MKFADDIALVQKKSNVKQMNDLRPVILTFNLATCMERLMCNQLVASVADRMDPLQIAYKTRRGVEDACRVVADLIANHLDKS